MNTGRFVFSQLILFLPQRKFEYYVEKYRGNYRTKHFTSWNHLLCMVFCQLKGFSSLYEFVNFISLHESKIYHLGLGKGVSKATLARSNQMRDYRIFAELSYELINILKDNLPDKEICLNPELTAMSRENIELCLSLCYFDLLEKNYIKGYTSLTSGKVIPKLEFVSKDIKNTDHSVETGGLYLFDFEYFDSYWLHEIFANQAFFVIPIQNISGLFKTMSQELEHIPYFDDTSEDFNSLLEYSGFLRIVSTNDSSDKNNSFYLTNFLDIPADEVTRLYRSRYQLKRIFFFLRKSIKNFMGTTPNAMRIQIYVLILIHVLMVLIKVKLNSKLTTSEIKNIVSRNLLSKESLHTLLIKVGQE